MIHDLSFSKVSTMHPFLQSVYLHIAISTVLIYLTSFTVDLPLVAYLHRVFIDRDVSGILIPRGFCVFRILRVFSSELF